jgi:hypothetical protein
VSIARVSVGKQTPLLEKQMLLSLTTRPPTLDELEKTGRPLEVGCYHCGIVHRIRPSWTGLRPTLTAGEVADKISCPDCGKSNNGLYHVLYSKPAARS